MSICKQEDIKYPLQECQNETLNEAFRNFHIKIVNEIIAFCKKWDIDVEEFTLNADGLKNSIKTGHWQPCTDSCFRLDKTYYGNIDKPYLISL